ncbi:hypothetical protein H113_05373 [Trichophyton rubrum MR1459]|uniref:Uncharacterized protein n=1 Tax=Trichophyton rubrum (strain ATCC MYA-4607 / CBS 118892) TaxID=559305 RepID=A0A080WI38_TRIRC|nr:uncharacterized protein TERG_11944 [Trichophyton rubrum CBS 118892]EZF94027.1 hypothetical protein H113_05373 [Trichophyton rubrum MR1459]EZG04916.1 hypothetical protein H106_05176 [Trichophyton rubrum CBS 735.88]KFL61064.1 hypothetical protein TERG_11944 [Trichophyton rubrum CBS 118892]
MEFGHQDRSIHRQDAVCHSILSEDRDVLFAGNRGDIGVECHADQGIGRVIAEQRGRQEPHGWTTSFARCVSDMQETSIGAQHRVLELEELHLARGSDTTKRAGTTSSIASESEPYTLHGTVARDHSDGVVANTGRNWKLRRLAGGEIDPHYRRVGILRDVDQAGGRLLLDKHGAVEAWVQLLVRRVGDIRREHIVPASLLGGYLEPGPDAVADLKHTMRPISWCRDINCFYNGRRSREILAGIHEEQLVVSLQRQPHHAGVHGRGPHAM